MKLLESLQGDSIMEAKKPAEVEIDHIPHLDADHENYEKYVKIFQRIKKNDPQLYDKILNWD